MATTGTDHSGCSRQKRAKYVLGPHTKLLIGILLILLSLVACENPIPEPTANLVQPPSIETASQLISVQILPGATEKRILSEEPISLYNCNGNAPLTSTVERSYSVFRVAEIGTAAEINVSGSLGVPGVGNVQVGAAIAQHYNVSYGEEETVSRSIIVSAKEGSHLVHEVQQFEIWETGEFVVSVGNKEATREPYRFRRDFGVEVISILNLQDCGTATAETGLAQPTSIPIPATINPAAPSETQTAVPTNYSPLPTDASEPSLPYVADWSQGFDGWAGDKSWKTVNGMIVNDGSGMPGTIWAPYKPGRDGVSDYAVEAEIQMIGEERRDFGIIVRSKYYAGYVFYTGGGIFTVDHHAATIAIGCPVCYPSEILIESPFGMDAEWHTYRAEVYGNEVRLLIDGREFVHVTDNRFLTGGEVGLWSYEIQLQVRSLRIEALYQ